MTTETPTLNVQAFQQFYQIESCLRELVIEELSAIGGARWHKTRLPPDVAERFKKGRAYEADQKSVTNISFHPIYYTDFSDLRKVIERSNNWDECFKALFGKNLKGLLPADLQAIEPVRNKTAHNRLVSIHEVEMVSVLRERLRTCLGSARFEGLIARSKLYQPVFLHFDDLATEITGVSRKIMQIEDVGGTPIWTKVSEAWWFDADYVGVSLGDVQNFFKIVEEYKAQPRRRGSGPALRKWLTVRDVPDASKAAEAICVLLASRSKMETAGD
jgi:hypothetical protein